MFIDGCFWHSCPLHATTPKANSEYWTPKLARNVARDAEVTAGLVAAHWTVMRFWEHEQPELASRSIIDEWSKSLTDEAPPVTARQGTDQDVVLNRSSPKARTK